MAELFGFRITSKKDDAETFTLPSSDDGAEDIATGGFFSSVYDIEGKDRTSYDLIKRYRHIAQQPECDSAIEDIVSEGIASNECDAPISLMLDGLENNLLLSRKEFVKNLIEFYNSYNFKKKDTISFVDGMLMVEYTTIK